MSYNKEKAKIYRERYKHKAGSYQIKYRQKRRKYIHEYKKTVSCVYCGCNNPLVIDFDHMDRSSKKGTLATMITGGYDWNNVLEEIQKCQPVCSNCHRMKTILESKKMEYIYDIEQYIPKKLLEEFK